MVWTLWKVKVRERYSMEKAAQTSARKKTFPEFYRSTKSVISELQATLRLIPPKLQATTVSQDDLH